ncbi:MAG: TonB-dependent receptor plug domain-containing protein [Bacteroidota bacterium]
MKYFLSYIFFLVSYFSFSQTGIIEGKCLDKKGNSLENVKVYVLSLEKILYTDENGKFSIETPLNQELEFIFRYDTIEIRKNYIVNSDKSVKVEDVIFPIISLKSVTIKGFEEQDILFFKLPKLDIQTFPNASVERTLIFTTAASSNNELTSNYNVRGGNYDENLVYVNDFLINRPFLTRSGQQEGLSFINTALVQGISFSGGGFDARYGDKLSSVLDITYKNPDSLNASVMASLLGVEAHVSHAVSSRLNYLAGARYRANGYLLNSLPTKGNYNPVFYDGQVLLNYNITENLVWSNIAHFSSNNYRFTPETQETDFGTVNEAYRFKIYFDGQEQTRFQTITTGTALKWTVNKKTQLDFYASVFNTDEQENFDIQGQYFINLLETDPSKEEFGDSIATVGIGTFLNHARNQLKATIINVYHNGTYKISDNSKLYWGVNLQKDKFRDVLSEWKMIDSAGFSLPQTAGNEVELFETIKSKLSLDNSRVTGFLQFKQEWFKAKENYIVKVKQKNRQKKITNFHSDTIESSYNRLVFTSGIRAGYTEINNEFFVTPRASLSFFPRSYFFNNGNIRKRSALYKLSSGLYYQPPFYREFRTIDGNLNLNVKSQKSFHIVGGYDFLFTLWDRDVPFKFSSEIYYKYMWDVNPYEVDNVRTRYYAENMATAYAYGLDINLHGEFVKGIESFFKVGLLSTKENIIDDQYTLYYNQAGERIYKGVSEDQVAVDSAVIFPKGIPRPTDQLLNFAILFQDNMPGYESFSVQLGLFFGTRLPYGPPDFERYKDTLRQKSYFRTDLGLSYDLLKKRKHAINKTTIKKSRFSDAIISFEVFNLMGINNVLSKQWIQDVSGKYYSIPNYLTQRRFNLKLILRI